jgi:hypothetical protein
MLDDDSPGFGVDFEIDAGGSVAEITQLAALMETAEVKMVTNASGIENATRRMIDLKRGSADVKAFSEGAVREMGQVASAKEELDRVLARALPVTAKGPPATIAEGRTAREINNTEKAIDGLILKLDRQTAAVGKSRDELQDMKIEMLALTAADQGNTDAVDRLVASARQLTQARRALAEDRHAEEVAATAKALRDQAAAEAAVNQQLLERSRLQTALDRTNGDDRPRATDAGATFSALGARAAEEEAKALREAAYAYEMFEAARRRGLVVLREQEAADAAAVRETQALAAASERLRASIDPAYAAQQRFNAEMAEARNLVSAGVVSLDEYCAKLRLERSIMEQSSATHDQAVDKSGALKFAYQNLGYQIQDVGAQLSTVSGPAGLMRIFSQQGGQIFDALNQIASAGGNASKGISTVGGASEEAGGDLGGLGDQAIGVAEKVENTGTRFSKFAGFMAGPWGAAIMVGLTVLGPLTAKLFETDDAATQAADGMKKFQDSQSDIGNFIDSTTGKLVEQNRTLVLNAVLTRQAQIANNNKAISESQNNAFDRAQKATLRATRAAPGTTTSGVGFTDDTDVQRVIRSAGGDVDKLSQGLATLARSRPELAKVALEVSSIGGQAIRARRENETLGKELRALGGDTTALANGTTSLIDKQVALATATTPLARARAELALVQQGASAADKAGGAALSKYRTDLTAATNAVHSAEAAEKAAAAAKRDSIKATNAAAAEARKEQNHAEELAREAASVEAQIKNLGGLIEAYQATGGAALIAEARVAAESKAIKQRGDIEAYVDRQVRLGIVQRTSDAEKATTAMGDQANAQAMINSLVADGLVPAERAAELVRDQMTDLPLLAAIQAATQIGNKELIDDATAALERQRGARARLRKEETDAAFALDQAAAGDQLAMLDAERRLIGATDAARTHELATLKATQEAKAKLYDPAQAADYIAKQVAIADGAEANRQAQDAYNASLTATADLFDTIDQSAQAAAQGMSDAFGEVGSAIGGALTVMTGFYADQARLQEQHRAAIKEAAGDQTRLDRENRLFALRSSSMQVAAFGNMASAAKGFFKEGSDGYVALATAEKAFRVVQFAMSVRAIAQDAIETGSSLANSAARTAANAVEAVTKAISSLPFPANIAAGAATIAALAAIGVSIAGGFGGGKNSLAKPNDGTGTVLGDPAAKSDSIKNAIEQLREVDLITNSYSRQMAASLRSIDSQIGGVAALVVRAGDVNASADVAQGFKTNAVGSVLKAIVPVFGGALASLFGTKTTVVGSGLYGGAQSLGSILDGGFDASYYSDVQKKKKLFGITTGTKYSTQLTGADAQLESQFTLILRGFNDAIAAAAGPLGSSTGEIEQRLRGFVVDIGKIDLKDLTGEQIQEKLQAVFGAAADKMALAAFPGFERFQKVGEGAFETLVRVATTVEQVTTALDQLGAGARSLGVDAKLGLADQFDSVSDMASAIDGYFQAFYTAEEQAAAKTRQLTGAFGSLGLTMPTSIAGFRQLVEAQDLTSAAGQSTYAMLLKLAPAFAELQSALTGTKSAADIASERQGLERQLLELRGDTAAIRALDLAKLDASNRALQQEIWAMQDGQAAAKAADELRQAWKSVGDSIMDEVRRIRGLTDATGAGSFASLLGQFNAANAAARGGDMDVAKTLPGLSQALLSAAADAATSRQELDRVRAQTAAALEETYGVVGALTAPKATTATEKVSAAADAKGGMTAPAANDDLKTEIQGMREDNAGMRRDLTLGLAQIAGNTGRIDKKLDAVTAESGGTAITVQAAAA